MKKRIFILLYCLIFSLVMAQNSQNPDLPSEFQGKDYLSLEEGLKPNIVNNFDFRDVDLKTVVETISKLTNKNFILAGNISGKITIMAPSEITVQEAYYAFLTALAMNQYGTVQQGRFIKILKEREIGHYPLQIYSGEYTPSTDQYITRVYQLKYISAKSVVKQLRDLQPKNGKIIAFEATNTLIMTGTGSALKRVIDILKILDQPINQESTVILTVKHASAKEIQRVLDQIIKKTVKPNSLERETPEVISSIIADDRTNSLIVTANQKGVTKIKELLLKLDIAEPASSSNGIHVYYCLHAKAEDMAATLTAIAKKSSKKASEPFGKRSGTRFDEAVKTGSGLTDLSGDFNGDVFVTSDKATNSLLITAGMNDYQLLLKVIEKLDIPRRQVYVEVTILEIDVDSGENYGINWAYLGQNGFIPVGFGADKLQSFVQQPVNAIAQATKAGLAGFFGLNPGSSKDMFTPRKVTIPALASQTQNGQINYFDVMGFIQMIQSSNNSNIVSVPQIKVLDNEEGSIEVSDNVQINKGVAISAQANVPSMSNFEYIKAGINLKMTPQINQSARKVILKLNIEVSDFGSMPQDGRGPDKKERTAQTTIEVDDDSTAVIGGLIKEKATTGELKVPILGDLLGWVPIVGWFFKSSNTSKRKQNLMIFITPKIIDTLELNRDLSIRKYNYRANVLENDYEGTIDDDDLEVVRELKKNIAKPIRESSTEVEDPKINK